MVSQSILGSRSVWIALALGAAVLMAAGCSPAAGDPEGGEDSSSAQQTAANDDASQTVANADTDDAQQAGDDGAEQADDSTPANAAPAKKPAGPPKDPFAIPEGDANTLLKFIDSVQEVPYNGNSAEEYKEHVDKVFAAILKATDKILASNPTDEQALQAITYQFQLFQLQFQQGDEAAGEKWAALVEKLKEDERPGISELVKQNSLMMRAMRWSKLDEKQRAEFAKEINKEASAESLSVEQFAFINQIASILEHLSDESQLAKELYESLLAGVHHGIDGLSADEAARLSEDLEGRVKYLSQLGQPMKIEGTLLDGSPFDWQKYQGKVVLVDFWATWCGPCVAEIPNVLANYKLYHDKGFEVVGVSLDDSAEDVKQFLADQEIPWPILFSHDEDTLGMKNPLAVRYKVQAIPAPVLVDHEGKIISLRARGGVLGKHLARLLGEPEKAVQQPGAEAPPEGAAPTPKDNPEQAGKAAQSEEQ